MSVSSRKSLLGETTLVVTGFPRSGTSMMMRMLEFGGLEILADDENIKPKGQHSPHGSRERKDVGMDIKSHDVTWTQGKAVKIVAPYIEWLPIDRPLKVIFMQRDVNEIISSLLAMRSIWKMDIAQTIADARGYIEYLGIPVHYIWYREAIEYPRATAIGIADFLEANLDIDAMVRAVDVKSRSAEADRKRAKLIRADFEPYKNLKRLVVAGGPIDAAKEKENVPGSTPETRPGSGEAH